MKQNTYKLRCLINFAALLALFAAAVIIGMTGGSTVKLKLTPSIWQCSYLIIMAASLNLVLGFLGQLSLGHCGFMAVGAYAAALFSLALQRAGFYTEKAGPAFFLVLVGSILIAGLAAALVLAVTAGALSPTVQELLSNALGGFGVLHLVADGHPVALCQKLRDVALGAVVGYAAHGSLFPLAAVPAGEGQIQLLRDGFRVVEEHLVKIA